MIATTSLPQLPEKTCTGCGGCTNACPKDAIFFAPDAEGFQHPVVQAAQCIGCKKCEQICPVLHWESSNIAKPDLYAVRGATFEQIAPLVAFSLWLPRKSLHGKGLSLEQRLTKIYIFRSPSPKMKSSLLPCGVQSMCRVIRNWFIRMH